MGLSGRKVKQRIGADPRNLTWSDDSSKFGAKYLQSLGWTSGSGLGASGEGRTSNLKIHQKLDLMGIGANRRGADDAGWKVGRQFDGLLERLNRAQNVDGPPVRDDDTVEERLRESTAEGEVSASETAIDTKEAKRKKKEEASERRKRKKPAEEDEEDAKVAKRRRKEEKKEQKRAEKKEKKAKKAKKSRSNSEVETEEVDIESSKTTPTAAQTAKVAPRYRAHRARHLASKRLAVASTTGMNEILGIASSSLSEQMHGPSSIPFPMLMTPSKQDPPNDDATMLPLARAKNNTDLSPDADDEDRGSTRGLGARSLIGGGIGFGASNVVNGTKPSGDDLLRKSGKSVAEYFAEKMRMKTLARDG